MKIEMIIQQEISREFISSKHTDLKVVAENASCWVRSLGGGGRGVTARIIRLYHYGIHLLHYAFHSGGFQCCFIGWIPFRYFWWCSLNCGFARPAGADVNLFIMQHRSKMKLAKLCVTWNKLNGGIIRTNWNKFIVSR